MSDSDPHQAPDPGEIEIRHLRKLEEFQACVDLQYETWGDNFGGCVPLALLQVTPRVGGITAGAFDAEGRMIGCLYGITGTQADKLVHWSDILAVTPRARGIGLGRRLKLFQRSELLAMGCEYMQWTYDPLQALNANLNINSLGVRPIEYVVDMYGDTGSDLHRGLGTDRFVVQWDMASSRVARILDGERPQPPKGWQGVPLANPNAEDKPGVEHADFPDVPLVRVAIPAEIDKAKNAYADAGAEWREATRNPFVHYLVEKGYTVGGFVPADDKLRAYYILQEKSS